MKPMTIRRTVLAIALVATSGWGPDVAQGQAKLSEKQATDIGAEVYIYGYPLVTLEMTRRVTTNTAEPVGLRAPMGQFAHAREYPPMTYQDIPGANADTLYCSAWLNLVNEPFVFSIPDADGRYFMMPMLAAAVSHSERYAPRARALLPFTREEAIALPVFEIVQQIDEAVLGLLQPIPPWQVSRSSVLRSASRLCRTD
jgi:hypothetical protein